MESREDTYRRYQVSGPRYTSYPSANHFDDAFSADEWLAAVGRSNDDPIPAPLSLYVHVPFCTSPCFFCACNRVITRRPEAAGQYLLRLKREIGLQAAAFDPDREFVQLHFGGGTPTTLGCAGLADVVDTIEHHFRSADAGRREWGIELDPRHAGADTVAFLADLGFNRVSFGVQDFDPAVQRAVNRVQSEQATLALLDAARESGFRAINVDLICGLPLQTATGFAHTLEQVIEHRPDRVAMYAYAHMPGKFKAQRRIDEADLPGLELKLDLMRLADDMLTAAGYLMIGMDHYALPDDPLAHAFKEGTLQRNFQGYATHAECDMVGLGVSAIGMTADCYAQNARDLPGYYAALDGGRFAVVRGKSLSVDDQLRRAIIHALMCAGRVEFEALSQRYGDMVERVVGAASHRLRELDHDGMVELDDDGITLTPMGRPLMRVVAMVFDAYLPGGSGCHSRVF